MPVKPDHAPLADRAASGGLALLIVDMISSWDFEDADKLGPAARAIAPRIGALKKRCAEVGVPAIYVNDNRGRWRSEFHELVRQSRDHEIGAAIAQHLTPAEEDYSVLKPKQSAFYATPLDLLLRHLRVRRLIVTGVATDQCIAMSAAEARMRDYDVVVPRDAVAAQATDRNDHALRQIEQAHRIATTPSAELELPARPGKPAG